MSKHTLCGYAWGDVGGALLRAISSGDMNRAQRWAAEHVCSESGLGRLEAILFHAWGAFVNAENAPGWALSWFKNIQHIRTIWGKSGGDLRTVRNTPSVRQSVAESVAWLVLAQKKALPKLPKPEDCFRESEAMRNRIRSGGGAGDQLSVKRIWVPGQDGVDLKTIGNELEAALRGNQTSRLLFWIIWLTALDTQKECPTVKERCPVEVTGKQRKSVLWFLYALLRDLMEEMRAVATNEREALFDLLAHCWMKLGARGRRDILVSIALFLQEKGQKSLSLVTPPPPQIPQAGIRAAMASIDDIYAEIAEEARRFEAETPQITELTAEAAAAAAAAAARKVPKLTSMDKLDIAYSFLK